jgi:hypothetical protein
LGTGITVISAPDDIGAPETGNDPPEKKSLRERFNVTVTIGSYHIGERDYQVSPETYLARQNMPSRDYQGEPNRVYSNWESTTLANGDISWTADMSHAEERRKYNEFNPGIGVNYEVNNWMHAGVGVYKNSIHNTSVYALVGAETNRSKFLGAGVEVGAVTGYNIPVAPSGVGFVRFGKESQFVNLKVSAIPPIPDVTPAVVAAQVRFNLGAIKPK